MPEKGIYFFNLILSVACRDIRWVTTAKESSLNSPPSEKGGGRVENDLYKTHFKTDLTSVCVYHSMASKTSREKERKIGSKSIGRRGQRPILHGNKVYRGN